MLIFLLWSSVFLIATAWELPEFMIEPSSLTSSTITQNLTVPGVLDSVVNNPSSVSSVVMDEKGQLRELIEGDDDSADLTVSPTESPAPSPSPSEIPTQPPTLTAKPTAEPTSDPTESPAPSPSPSEIPTSPPSDAPSTQPTEAPSVSSAPSLTPSTAPSSVPSGAPSNPPSIAPTLSRPPSAIPSTEPSDIPSSSPSVSDMPSSVPSFPPTSSAQPSSFPTHIDSVSGNFFVNVKLRVPALRSEEMRAFERATKSWVEFNDATSGILKDVEVTIIRQSLVDVIVDKLGRKNDDRRTLQTIEEPKENARTMKKLQLKFSVVAMYIGTDKNFDLEKELSHVFENKDPTWVDRLIAENDVFEPIKTGVESLGTTGAIGGSDSQAAVSGVSVAPAGMAAIALIAVGAIMLGTIASVYSIKSHRGGLYGKELRSPTHSSEDEDDEGRTKKAALAFQSDRMDVDERQAPIRTSILSQGRKSDGGRKSSGTDQKKESKNDAFYNAVSPNTLERGPEASKDNRREIPDPVPYNSQYANDNQYSYSSQQHINRKPRPQRPMARDPPTAASEVSAPSGYTQNFNPRQTSLHDTNTEVSSQISDLTRSRMTNSVMPGELAGSLEYDGRKNAYGDREADDENNNHRRDSNNSGITASRAEGAELTLTKSIGGTLGASAITGNYAESVISEQSEFFYTTKKQKERHGNQSNSEEGNNLGARPVAPEEERQLQERSSYESITHRAGLYDVFAPAGPIGIVVDTTKYGPAVHSLKPTSPMRGLINPGDLIVGLDDIDTRSMTAATLTKLMARKSNQKERKITLLAAESY